MPEPVTQFKERQRAMWASGAWDEAAALIAGVGPKLLDRVGLEPGMDVLDVGTGSGSSVAIPAAQRGARVVGSDLTPELFEFARRRAAGAGVDVEWVQADAEALPFEAARFDRVLSTFGHMFAPRHAHAAAELARVCRPGGIVGMCTWTPEGLGGAFSRPMGDYLPPPPDFAEDALLWGTEAHVRELLEPHGLALHFARDHVTLEFDTPDAAVGFWETRLGPCMMTKKAAGERWPELRRALVAVIEDWNRADDGVRLEQEYLVTIGKRAG